MYDPAVDLLLVFPIALLAFWFARARAQQQRIALLARYLSRHDIEKHIETLAQGYLRALGEDDPERRDQVWGVLRPTEQALCRQVRQLADEFAQADPGATRVSKLPVWLPGATTLAGAFDMREALKVHARGICRAIEDADALSAKDRAFTITAEMLLLQHTCHWFCRSKTLASARLLARHRTPYAQVVASILPQTRADYLALVG